MKNRPSLAKLITVSILVIALMGIGVFAFKYFSKSAENTRALQELKQAQEVMLTNMMSTTGEVDKVITCDGITFKYEMTKGKIVFSGSSKSMDDGKTLTRELREAIPELKELDGSYKWDNNTIYYITSNGNGQAKWVSGKNPTK